MRSDLGWRQAARSTLRAQVAGPTADYTTYSKFIQHDMRKSAGPSAGPIIADQTTRGKVSRE
eukprot:691260-Amphidinium_carterae.1